MEKAHRISVLEASEILDMSPSSVRAGMRQGKLPIGTVFKTSSEYSYYIYEEKIDQFLNGKPDNASMVNVLDQIMDFVSRLKEELQND